METQGCSKMSQNRKGNMGTGENTKENMGTGDYELRVKPQPKRRGFWKALKVWGSSSMKKLSCKNNSPLEMDKRVVVPLPSRPCRREEENLRRLIKNNEIKLQLQVNVQKSMAPQGTATKSIIAPPIPKPSLLDIRNCSVGVSFGSSIAPIDEESPCYFPGSFKKRWSTPLPLNGSYGFSASS